MSDKPVIRVSRVPKFKFAGTLETQERQLADNELVKRFAVSRKNFASDRYRPKYHFTSPESKLNDPNGLCYWQGRWHLFYQAYPPEDCRWHWGHAVSDDLIHWRDLPYAIYPDREEFCYSGTALVEEDRVIAMYHGTEAGNMIAVSDDPLLLNWKKLTRQPVISNAKDNDPYRIFDPCIWNKDGFYYSLSGWHTSHTASGKRMRTEFLFRSENLTDWEYMHPFLEDDIFGLPGDDGACPYFWPIGDKHILLHFSHMSGGKYMLGDYDTKRDKFCVTGAGDFNFGPFFPGGVHAPSACPDGKGGVVVIFNMNQAKPTEGWDQIMSLPRLLRLIDGELMMEPTGDIESLRGEHCKIERMVLPANKEIVLDGIRGDSIEMEIEIDPQDAAMVELNVLRSPDKQEFTRIAFYKNRGYRDWDRYDGWQWDKVVQAADSLISIDSSYSSTLPDVLGRGPETAPVYIAPGEMLKLRVFVDKSVVEVFVNGKQCVAMRVYPGRNDSDGVSIRAQGGDGKLVKLDFWQMKNIMD